METNQSDTQEPKRKKSTTAVVVGLGAVSVLYLLNPGFGFIELIPDTVPVIGNLDEAAATALLISCFAYFGVDIAQLIQAILGLRKTKPEGEEASSGATGAASVTPETIDVETT